MEHHVVEATTKIGYPVGSEFVRWGSSFWLCHNPVRDPRTEYRRDPLTGYIGGAVAQQGSHRGPNFQAVLFGCIRHPRMGWRLSTGARLRTLITLRRVRSIADR